MQYARGNYGEIYDASDSGIRNSVTRDQMIALLQKENTKLGACGEAERQGFRINYNTNGRFVTMDYSRKCANGQLAENFVWLIKDGKAVLYGYHFNSSAE